jgi:tRNA threonylcarbamoyladenosine biosynthesis protein TsaB
VVCAALDARRDEVYAGAYRIRRTEKQRDAEAPESLPARLTIQAAASAMSVEALPGWIGIDRIADGDAVQDDAVRNDTREQAPRLWLLGNGAAKSETALRTTDCPIRRVPEVAGRPSAAWVARCAVHALRNGKASEPETFEPMYLKAFHAG